MEQYGITELARLFGISTEALRKYEAKGLLESARNQDNQFRKYDIWDIGMLSQIRSLREMEFSLNEVNELIQKGELPELEAALRQKKEAAADIILKYQEHFHILEQVEREVHELADRRDSFWLEYSPAHYGIDFGKMVLPEEGPLRDAIQSFMQRVPFAFFCGLFDQEQTYCGSRLALEEKYLTKKEREELGEVLVYIPSRLCACMMLGEGYGNLIENQLREQVHLIEERGYRVTGDTIAKVVFWNKKSGNYYAYHRVWIPIEKF